MEKEQTQVEQELKVNPDLEEKMDTPKLNNTLKPSSETNINTVNFIQAILAKDDLSKKKILKTFLVLLSLCIAIYYYFAVSTAQNITS
ncbi:MAG: hypothetical protein LBQ24_00425 [Candidatus Peribacteria bacterium]|jgi:hypothetical protein|nr:hypothetical protein [Candidatus Peribacteria bacterium]